MSLHNLMTSNLVWGFFGLALLVFWIWQFVSVFSSKISKTDKGLWFIAFLVFSPITPFVWFVVKPKMSRRKK